jgi:excisionase family DNA binding protein
MANNLLSTQELASLMNVTETTIKRWADEGKVACRKTLGGHRKFVLKDVIRFAEEHSISLSGHEASPSLKSKFDSLEFAIYTNNYSKISERFFIEAMKADGESLYALLLYLYRHHISFPVITDEVIRPALNRIGEKWMNGELEVNQEHRASHAIAEAMIRLAPDLHHKAKNGYSVVCACPEGEYHEFGIRSLAYALATEGWNVHYIGANTPVESMKTFVKEITPELICLSFTILQKKSKLIQEVRTLGALAHSYGAKLIIGGYNTGKFSKEDFDCDEIAHSVHDAVAYIRHAYQLKPGPKSEQRKS